MNFGYSPFSTPSYWEVLSAEKEHRERLRREQAARERAEYLRQVRELEERRRHEEALKAHHAQEEAQRRRSTQQRRYGGMPFFSPFFGYPGFEDEDEEYEQPECPIRWSSPQPPQQSSKTEIEGASSHKPNLRPSPSRAPSPQTQATEANKQTDPGTTETTAQPTQLSDKIRTRAATTIQEQWRLYKARQASLSSIERYQSQFDSQRSSFAFPSYLDFSLSSLQPTLLYTSNNAPVHAYENDLTKLLTQLDGVDSVGSDKVRQARKSLVHAIEAELGKLEWKKVDIREAQEKTKRAEEEKEVEMELDPVKVDAKDVKAEAPLPTDIPLPESPEAATIPLPEDDEDSISSLRQGDEPNEDAAMENEVAHSREPSEFRSFDELESSATDDAPHSDFMMV